MQNPLKFCRDVKDVQPEPGSWRFCINWKDNNILFILISLRNYQVIALNYIQAVLICTGKQKIYPAELEYQQPTVLNSWIFVPKVYSEDNAHTIKWTLHIKIWFDEFNCVLVCLAAHVEYTTYREEVRKHSAYFLACGLWWSHSPLWVTVIPPQISGLAKSSSWLWYVCPWLFFLCRWVGMRIIL